MSRARGRRWTMTLWTKLDWASLIGDTVRFLIVGEEICPDTGRMHWQSYAEFHKPMEVAGLAKIFGKGNKFILSKGDQDSNITYCSKDAKVEEFGDRATPGKRNDLDKVREMALEDGMRGVTKVCNMQQIRVAEKFLTYNEEPRDWECKVVWLWGPSGAGKSRRAREICVEDVYVKNAGTKWWDGYDAHENVIIDDFRDSWWGITEMLSLLDRYEKQVEVKGGFRQFKPKTIVVTSINKPESFYKNTGESIRQLTRRITEIVYVPFGTENDTEVGG